MPPCRNNSLPNETASDEGERQGTVLFFQSGAAGNQSLKHVDICCRMHHSAAGVMLLLVEGRSDSHSRQHIVLFGTGLLIS